MTESTIDIRTIRSASRQALIQLYQEAGWWKEEYWENAGFLDRIVKNSTVFAGAFDGDQLIGMGRALSDGFSDAYIQDVTVLTRYRGRGIGARIIKTLIRELKATGVDWIGLIAEPDTGRFYQRLGFRQMIDHIPFVLEESFE